MTSRPAMGDSTLSTATAMRPRAHAIKYHPVAPPRITPHDLSRSKEFAAIAGIASLIAGAFWHLSADTQVKALKLSGEATAALSKVEGTPTPAQEALANASRAAGEAANALTFHPAQHNLYAAIREVVARSILAVLAGTD